MDQGRVIETGTTPNCSVAAASMPSLWARQSGGFLAKEAAE